MPAKYYCDYCDKAFADNPAARRKHIQSTGHQATRKAWFDSFRDPAELLAENPSRGICVQMTRTGSCPYGFKCKYIHPARSSQDDLPAGRLRTPRNEVPPSLRPPPQGGYGSSPAIDWG